VRRAGLLLGLAVLMTASGAQAATLTVTTFGDPPSPPTCTPGNCTLRAAIALANSDGTSDTIQIPAGEYKLNAAAGGQLSITASMTLAGAGARVTTIRAATNSQIFVVSAGTVALDDLTLTGAEVEQEGGAVQAEGEGKTSLTIERDIVTNNHLLGDHDGGGIHTREGEVVPVLIDSSTVSGNSAHGGGGVDGSGPFRVVNSTLTGNHVVSEGAAMEVERTTLVNDTISGNECEGVESGGEGCDGGVRFLEELPPPPVAISTAQDTIIAGNTDMKGNVDNCGGRVTNLGPNLENGTECEFSIQGNPLLGSLADNGGPTPTMFLGAGSSAIGAGTNATCAKQDQRGGARPAPGGGQCDIGAVEVNSLADLAITGQASPASVTLGGGITYTLTATNLGPDPALSATVENLLPAGATFVTATTAAGSCAGSTTLTCALGTLAPGASVAVNVSATLGLAGTATDVASAHAPATDTSRADNQTSILATVLAPVIVAPNVLLAPVAPVLSHLANSPARFRVGSAPTAVTASVRTPRGTTIGFTLNERARVRIVLQRKLSGRRRGGRCLAPRTRVRPQQEPLCTRLVVVGTLTRTGAAGANRVAFSGRVGAHPLSTGSYIATLTASVTGAAASVPAGAGFTIVRG
jgi:uncharacterized repeat protein (TIGR01451 family)/CSLREA domain-containing protein